MSKCIGWARAAAMAACFAAIMSSPARAAEDQTAALQACVKLNTSGKDRLVTARWLAGALASTPQVADFVKVDPAKKQQLDKDMAQLFTRLLTVDCRAEAKASVKTGDAGQMGEDAGTTLGQIAIQELMTDKDAATAMSAFATYLKQSDFDALKN